MVSPSRVQDRLCRGDFEPSRTLTWCESPSNAPHPGQASHCSAHPFSSAHRASSKQILENSAAISRWLSRAEPNAGAHAQFSRVAWRDAIHILSRDPGRLRGSPIGKDLILKKHKLWIGIGGGLVAVAFAYLSATAVIHRNIDDGLSALRSGALSKASHGVFALQNLQVTSGFFTRSGTANLVISLDRSRPMTLPVSFTIHEAPTLTSPAGADFVVGLPQASDPTSLLVALHVKHLLTGTLAHHWGGENVLLARMDPIHAAAGGTAIQWDGATIRKDYSAADFSVSKTKIHISPLHVDDSAVNTHVTIGAIEIVNQTSARVNQSMGAMSDDVTVGASSANDGKTAFSLRQASLHAAAEWNFSRAGNPGISVKNVDAQIDMAQPAGAATVHLDALIPMDAQQAQAMRDDQAVASEILRQSVMHADFSVSRSMLSEMPTLAMLALRYGRINGANVDAQVTVRNGQMLIDGKSAL